MRTSRLILGALCGASLTAADLPLVDGSRIVFVGDSLTHHVGWPTWSDYVTTYLVLRNPDKTLYITPFAKSGEGLAGFLDGSGASKEFYAKWATPMTPDYVFSMFADNGSYSKATYKAYAQSLVDDHIVGISGADPVLVGMIPQSTLTGYALGSQYDDANQEIAEAATPDWLYYKTWQALDDTWTGTGAKTFTASASTDTLTSAGHGFSNGDRVIFSLSGSPAGPTGISGNTYYYIINAATDTFQVSTTSGGSAADITTDGGGTNYVSRYWAWYRDPQTDGVHQSNAASIIAAWDIITGLGWGTDVSSATINAATLTATSQTDCTIGTVTSNGYGGVDFTRLDAKLPWAIHETWQSAGGTVSQGRAEAVAAYPALEGWQSYTLTVSGLPTGTYDVLINGTDVADVTAAELAAGWNMADLTTGPVWEKGQAVLDAIHAVKGFDPDTLLAASPNAGVVKFKSNAEQQYTTNGLRDAAYAAAMASFVAELDTLNEAVNTAAQPETLTFSIRRQNAWFYPGVPYTDWAYDPFNYAAPTEPANWPSAEQAGYYYVAPDDVNATDTVDGSDTTDASGRRYGYPARPRATLPLSNANTNTFPAGTVIWMAGGTYETTYSTFRPMRASFQGTAESPCWIYGDPNDRPEFRDGRITPYDSEYLFIENIDFRINDVENNGISINANDKTGASAYIAIRNCDFQDRVALSAAGSLITIEAPDTGGTNDADIHDIVVYNCTFSNNGLGSDYTDELDDSDLHAIKVDGYYGVNRSYRIWLIENTATLGATTDSDGFQKSISGSFIQLGDQQAAKGNVDHVYVAGNSVTGVRQACVGVKRCGPIVVSSNTVLNMPDAASSTGQAFGAKYDRRGHSEGAGTGEGIWFVNNYVDGAKSGYISAVLDTVLTHAHAGARTYLVGNLFTNLNTGTFDAADTSASLGSWKRRGIALHERGGKTYIIGNTVDDAGYGVVTAGNSKDEDGGEVHIYNNIFSVAAHASDPLDGDGISVFANGNPGTTAYFIENNLMASWASRYTSTTYTSVTTYNARSDAAGNLVGTIGFTNSGSNDYTLTGDSAAISAGAATTSLDSVNTLTLFTTAFTSDPDFPGDPADVWPYDRANKARVNGTLDVGAYEYYGAGGGGGNGNMNANQLSVGTLTIGN